MATAADLAHVIKYLCHDGGTLSDGQLLARFVATRDEALFAALVRRHGRMVLGVCRRVLRDAHDAEDVFQLTFLTLARKAASVVNRDSLGAWLYRVAYHAALETAAARARRRSVERQVTDPPHPEVFLAEPDDWRPLLDLELNRLPEKYRAAVVLCDLEGRTRREAARHLGIPEGTLSSRLAAAHKLLGQRLARCGLVLSVCAVSAALAEGRASAVVPMALVEAVAKAAAESLTAVPWPAVNLWKGALRTMLISKWWPVMGAVIVAGALTAVGVGLRPGDTSVSAQAAPAKPDSELEALRKENELLKLNLQIVLEKFRALEAEVETLRAKGGTGGAPATNPFSYRPAGQKPAQGYGAGVPGVPALPGGQGSGTTPKVAGAAGGQNLPGGLAKTVEGKLAVVNEDAVRELETMLKMLRETKDKDAQLLLTEALEKALKKLKGKGGQ